MIAFQFDKKSDDGTETWSCVMWQAEDGTWVVDGAASDTKSGTMVKLPQRTFDGEEKARTTLESEGYEYGGVISQN